MCHQPNHRRRQYIDECHATGAGELCISILGTEMGYQEKIFS
jgi:hypothetical protein